MSDRAVEDRVLSALACGSLTTTEIHHALCNNVAGLADVLFELVEVGRIEKVTINTGRGRPVTTWRLPEASAPDGQAMAVDTAEAEPLILGRELGPVEIDKLILAPVRGMGDLGAAEGDISSVVQWAMKLPPTNRALCLVQDGKLWLRVYGEGQVSFVDSRPR